MEDDILVFCLALGSERAAEELKLKINSIPLILPPQFKLCDFVQNCLSNCLRILNEHELCSLLSLNPEYYPVLAEILKKPVIEETNPNKRKRKRKRKRKKPKKVEQAKKPIDININIGNISPVVKIIECEVCSKKFKFASQLILHRRIHTGDKPYSCSHCDYKSTQKSNLNKHINLVHNVTMPRERRSRNIK